VPEDEEDKATFSSEDDSSDESYASSTGADEEVAAVRTQSLEGSETSDQESEQDYFSMGEATDEEEESYSAPRTRRKPNT
jgi:hypothetical protein